MIQNPIISVVIPVKNEAKKIDACIQHILLQTIKVSEIIVIDSGSTDGTQELVKKYDITKLLQISPTDFNHGETRNFGVRNASGNLVLFTVGDAKAADKYWIENLLAGFINDDIVAVSGQQIVPHDLDKNPVMWFRPRSVSKIQYYQYSTPEAFDEISPEEKKVACGWDDVTAIYKKEALREIPFDKITYGEDGVWAKRALLNGWAIAYNSGARVYHYHNEDADFTFKRSFTTMYFRYKEFGYIPDRPNMSTRRKLSILKTLWNSVGSNFFLIIKWYRYNIKNHNAIVKAYVLFMESRAAGAAYLDEMHLKYCGKPPVPIK
jgi:rhamnosyltransferase